MRPFTHIIASCEREARVIARKQGLRPGQWRYVSGPEVLEGLRDPTIIATRCWPWIGPSGQAADIERCLDGLHRLYGTEVTTVDCE